MDNIDIFDPNFVNSQNAAYFAAQAAATNKQREADYIAKCAQWVVVATGNRDRGIAPPPVPVKPLKMLPDSSETAWPELPDPVLPPAVPAQTSNPLVGRAMPPDPVQTKLDLILSMLRVLKTDIDALKVR